MHYVFSFSRSTGCRHVRVLNGRAFIDITITQLRKPMASQFDDWFVTGYSKTMTS